METSTDKQRYHTSMKHRSFFRELALSWTALFDKRTPAIAKIFIVFGLLYGVSPLDLVPDFIPLLGQLDDVGLIVAAVLAFLRLSASVRDDLRRRDSVETTAQPAK